MNFLFLNPLFINIYKQLFYGYLYFSNIFYLLVKCLNKNNKKFKDLLKNFYL